MRAMLFSSISLVVLNAVPAPGQSFDVTVNEFAPGVALTQPDTDPATLVMDDLLVEGVSVPGDYNGNGIVEQADLDLVLLHWGDDTPPIPSGWIVDLPGGPIDQEELDAVLLNWGASAADAHTPEPSTVTLLAILGIVAAGWWRRLLISRSPSPTCGGGDRGSQGK